MGAVRMGWACEEVVDMFDKSAHGYSAYIFFMAEQLEPEMEVTVAYAHAVDPVFEASIFGV